MCESSRGAVFCFEHAGEEILPIDCPLCSGHDLYVGNSLEFLVENPVSVACLVAVRTGEGQLLGFDSGQEMEIFFPGDPIVISAEMLQGYASGHLDISFTPVLGLVDGGLEQLEDDFRLAASSLFRLYFPEDGFWEATTDDILADLRGVLDSQGGSICTFCISYTSPEEIESEYFMEYQAAVDDLIRSLAFDEVPSELSDVVVLSW